jgi:Na+/proline symporter
MKPRRSRSLTLANFFGTLGYLSLVIQWSWAGLLLLVPFITSGGMDRFFAKKAEAPAPQALELGAITPVVTIIGILFSFVIVAITIVVLLKLPRTIGRKGAQLSHSTARAALPIVTRNRPLPEKKRMRLSYRIILALKLTATLLPLALLCFAVPTNGITTEIIWTLGLFCALCTLVYFGAQQLIVALRKPNLDRVW